MIGVDEKFKYKVKNYDAIFRNKELEYNKFNK